MFGFRLLTWIGIVASTSWVSFWYGYYQSKIPEAGLLLNELGDFLAGVMSPLALFWLVIGYFQQGEELQQNTKALLAQERELSKQARAMERLAESTKNQLHHEIEKDKNESKPKFNLNEKLASPLGDEDVHTVTNMGGDALNLKVLSAIPRDDISLSEKNVKKGMMFELTIQNQKIARPFSLSCTDMLDIIHKYNFYFDVNGVLKLEN